MESITCDTKSSRTEEFEKVESKMKLLCKFILEQFSEQLIKYKAILEKKYSTAESNVSLVNAAGSSLAGKFFKAVSGIGSTLYKRREYHLDRDFAKRLSKTIHSYDQNKEEYQKILIEAGIKIFIAYEFQFVNCYVDNHDETRALKKIAYDIVMKTLNDIDKTNGLSVEMITKSVIESEWNLLIWIKNKMENKQNTNRKRIILEYEIQDYENIKLETETNDIFVKPGLRVKENGIYLFYIKKDSNPSLYGYRNSFDGEIINLANVIRTINTDVNYTYKLSSVNICELIEKYYNEFTYNVQEALLKINTKLLENQEQENANNLKSHKLYTYDIKENVFNFVGREEYLTHIDKCFFQDNKKKVVICGMPGMGKTELLKKYITDNLDTKFHNIIWINADHEDSMKSSFSAIAKRFSIAEQVTVCAGDISSMLRAVFTKLKENCISNNKETLLVYDNVENIIKLKEYLPFTNEVEDGRINILITSRKTQWAPTYEVLHLNKISDAESLLLIRKTIENKEKLIKILDKDDKWAKEVIRINEGLPLALQQAIAYIIEEGISAINPFEVYLTNFTVVLDKLYDDEQPLPDYFENEYPNTLYVTYKMILNKLKTNKNNNNKTVTIMQICSFLDPNGVNKSFLYNLLKPEEVNCSIHILENYSLIQTTDDLVVVHRLLLSITRILYLKEKSEKVFNSILKFNLQFNYLVQFNSVTLVTSDQFFTFLRSVYSNFIFQYIDENIEEVKEFYKTLSNAEKVRLYLLMVYHGCTETVISISETEGKHYCAINFLQLFDINEICNKMENASKLFTEQDDKVLGWLNRKKYSGSALNIACIEGHMKISKYFIDKVINNDKNVLNYTNSFHMPIIHCALHREHIEIFKYLMENGANIHSCDENGSTLLHVASSVGQYDIIDLLLEKKIQLDIKNNFGDTILHSFFYNQIYPKEQLKYLFTPISRDNLLNNKFIQHDLCHYFKAITKHSSISIFIEDSGFANENNDYISIYYKKLKKKNHDSFIKIINKYGTCTELTTCNNYGLHPSHLHALSNNVIIKDDPWSTIETPRVDNFGNDPFKYASANNCWNAINSKIENISDDNNFGFTILHTTVCSGNMQMCENILNQKNINKTDKNGCSLLHVALLNKHYDLATWLIDNGVDVNQTFDGLSALHLAAAAGQLKIIQELLNNNAVINKQDNEGWSALHYILATNSTKFENKSTQSSINDIYRQSIDQFTCSKKEKVMYVGCAKEEEDAVELSIKYDFILKQSCKKNNQDCFFCSFKNPLNCLFVVSDELKEQIIDLLILRNIDVNLVDDNNNSCLHFACYFGNNYIVNELLRVAINININASNNSGTTALSCAAYTGHLSIVELLLEAGADVNAYGTTAIHCTCEGINSDIVKKLIEQGDIIEKPCPNGCGRLICITSKDHLTTVELLCKADVVYFCTNYGSTALHWASTSGNLEVVKKLIEKGADIKKQTANGQTALDWAIDRDHLATAEWLLDAGADVHVCDYYGVTALHRASQWGLSNIVAKLIKNGAAITKQSEEGETALHRATWNGHLTTIELLLAAGADIHACTNKGFTVLHYASEKGYLAIATKFIENGADVNKQVKEGQTALHLAAWNGHFATLELLLRAGADIHACTYTGDTVVNWASIGGHSNIVRKLIEQGADIKKQGKQGQTALHDASFEGHLAIVELLLEEGVDIHARTTDGFTALICASEMGHSDIVTKLIENGADINKPNNDGQNALHTAAYNGQLTTVEILLEAGADVHICMTEGESALHAASERGHSDIVTKLIEKGVDINKQTKEGHTALHIATCEDHLATVELLLTLGADIHATTNKGESALHLASEKGHLDIVKRLIENGTDINKQDKEGQTALHSAAYSGHLAVVELLLTAGVDVHAYTNNGATALYWASDRGHSDIVTKLIEKGADVKTQGNLGQTALHLAAYNGHLATVELLLTAGADINACMINGLTALNCASKSGHSLIVTKLIEEGAMQLTAKKSNLDMEDPIAIAEIHACMSKRESILHWASERGYSDIVIKLIANGTDIKKQSKEDQTALHFAAYNGHLAIVEQLLMAGVDINARTNKGESALHLASEKGHSDIVLRLIENGADIEKRDKEGQTALHNAVYRGHLATVDVLLAAGADIYIRNNKGDSILHLALDRKHSDIVTKLIEKSKEV